MVGWRRRSPDKFVSQKTLELVRVGGKDKAVWEVGDVSGVVWICGEIEVDLYRYRGLEGG